MLPPPPPPLLLLPCSGKGGHCNFKRSKSGSNVRCSVYMLPPFQVLYPTPALFDVQTGKLQPAFCKVLARVFRIHDHDFDGLWSVAELKDFQLECFGSGLSEDEIGIIKMVGRGLNWRDEKENSIMMYYCIIFLAGFVGYYVPPLSMLKKTLLKTRLTTTMTCAFF